MIKDENEEIIDISFKTYKDYVGKYFGGCAFLLITNFSMQLYAFFSLAADYVVGDWTNSKDQYAQFWYYSELSLIFAVLTALSITLRVGSILWFSLKSDRKLHEEMITRVVNAPINLYYDVTPIGRVLNKFSSDLNDLSSSIGNMYGAELWLFYCLV